MKGVFRGEIELGVSSADKGFVTLASGLELRRWPAARFTPFAKVSAGFLGEPGHLGVFAGATGGFLLRVGDRSWLLLGASGATHGEEDGPHSLTLGLERGIGPTRM